MKTFLITALAIAFMTNPSAFANDPKAAMDPKQQEMMKAFTEYATPSEAHKILAGTAGKWTYTSKMWQSVDAKPEESTGKSNSKMIMGGRFLQHEFKGKAMGMPFEGLGLTGYNNLTKKYETLWLDNMATGMMHGTGTFDQATQTLKDSGEFSCPLHPKKAQNYRTELKIVDKNNMTFTMWAPGTDDKEYKNMEITYKRAK